MLSRWLDDELNLAYLGEGTWIFENAGECSIALSKLPPRSFKHLELERTRMQVIGPENVVAEFYRLFELRFLSAGG